MKKKCIAPLHAAAVWPLLKHSKQLFFIPLNYKVTWVLQLPEFRWPLTNLYINFLLSWANTKKYLRSIFIKEDCFCFGNNFPKGCLELLLACITVKVAYDHSGWGFLWFFIAHSQNKMLGRSSADFLGIGKCLNFKWVLFQFVQLCFTCHAFYGQEAHLQCLLFLLCLLWHNIFVKHWTETF